jgi:hypothetical protein
MHLDPAIVAGILQYRRSIVGAHRVCRRLTRSRCPDGLSCNPDALRPPH